MSGYIFLTNQQSYHVIINNNNIKLGVPTKSSMLLDDGHYEYYEGKNCTILQSELKYYKNRQPGLHIIKSYRINDGHAGRGFNILNNGEAMYMIYGSGVPVTGTAIGKLLKIKNN
jgi:hypothetical protein